MGRSLFSLSYPAPEPIVRTEPEPKVDICERWSSWSHFDPDSEDFFQDAEFEAFIDPAQLARERAQIAAMAAAEGTTTDSSDSSDSSDSDQGSPMAVGSDDPADLIAGAYNSNNRSTAPWEVAPEVMRVADAQWRTFASAAADRAAAHPVVYTTSPAHLARSPIPITTAGNNNTDQLGNPAFIPPAVFRAPTPTRGIDDELDGLSTPPRSPTLRRTVNITPINVSRIQVHPATRSPSPDSPDSPASPATPPPTIYRQAQSMMTPSPPPSVTPRFYSWQHHPLPAIPTSPTAVRGARDGPLTNPRARMSFTRIDSPARIRIPNTVM